MQAICKNYYISNYQQKRVGKAFKAEIKIYGVCTQT
jgi:hypothetical protein